MAQMYDLLSGLIQSKRKNETAQYAISTERRRDLTVAFQAIKALFANLPLGLTQFAPAALTDLSATYLLIDLSGPEGNITYHQQLTLKTIGFVARDGETFAVDLAKPDETLGLVCDWSFRRSGEPDWTWNRASPDYRKVWSDLARCGQPGNGNILLPLTGPLLAHKAIARMAKFAASILAGGQPETAALNRHDRAQAGLRKRNDEIRETARKAAESYPGLAAVIAANPALVEDFARMDWSYQEADRFIASASDRADRIRDGLYALDLDTAAALFVNQSPIYWTSMIYYLDRHPARRAIAA